MTNIFHLPLPEMSDEDFELLEADSLGRMLAKSVDRDIELDCVRSWARSLQARVEAMQVRRLRWLILGTLSGALVMAALDGSAAQKLDRFLTWCGWLS